MRINDYLFQVVGIVNQPRAMLMPVQANETLFMPADSYATIYANPQISNVIIRAAPGGAAWYAWRGTPPSRCEPN